MANHSSNLAWKIPWTEESTRAAVHGVAESGTTEQLTLCLFSVILKHPYTVCLICNTKCNWKWSFNFLYHSNLVLSLSLDLSYWFLIFLSDNSGSKREILIQINHQLKYKHIFAIFKKCWKDKLHFLRISSGSYSLETSPTSNSIFYLVLDPLESCFKIYFSPCSVWQLNQREQALLEKHTTESWWFWINQVDNLPYFF